MSPAAAHQKQLSSRIIEGGCTAVALVTPLKLSWTYALLIPLLGLWLFEGIRDRRLLKNRLPDPTFFAPLLFFVLMCGVSVAMGLAPLHSLQPFLSFCFFGLTIFLFADRARPEPVLSALIVGQCIASIHSILDGALGGSLGSLFIGKVTESGQLALTILLAIGLAVSAKKAAGVGRAISTTSLTTLSAATTIDLSVLAFRSDLSISLPLALAVLVLIAVAVTTVILRQRENSAWRTHCLLIGVQLPLMIAALLVNLKRGPWIGMIVGTVVFSLCFAPRLLRWIAAAAICAVIFVTPGGGSTRTSHSIGSRSSGSQISR
jgi:hypothetical protein